MKCRIVGCGHTIVSLRANSGQSWYDHQICACCALELFPDGYQPPRGRRTFYSTSSRCNKYLREEVPEFYSGYEKAKKYSFAFL